MLYTSAQIQIHLNQRRPKTNFSSLTRLMPRTAPSTASQGRKSLRTKVPTRKQREASKIPAYRGKKLVPNALSVDSSEDENTSSDTASNESEPSKTPTPEPEEEEEATFDDTITFDASYTAFIGKEEVYAKSETVRLGKWDPSDFDDKASVRACREAVSQNIEINLKHKCASITANGRKPFKNWIEDEEDVEQVNLKVCAYFSENAKNIRLDYIVLFAVKSTAGSGKRTYALDNDDTGSSKRPKVR